MSETRSLILNALLALILTPLALCAQDPASGPAGHWVGFGDVVVGWTKARTLAADLTIAEDGKVTGTIGDASVTAGRCKTNRGRLASALGWKTEFVIEGELEGAILSAEGLVRRTFSLPFDFDRAKKQLKGSVATDGRPYGGFDKESFVAKLVLSRR